MFSEYHNLGEWIFTAFLVACLVWPCLFYFRGTSSTVAASIVVGLHLAPCYWLTLFDPNWNGWVPSARVTAMLVMDGLFGDGGIDFELRPSWWISTAVTATIAFILLDRVKTIVSRQREVARQKGLPPVF